MTERQYALVKLAWRVAAGLLAAVALAVAAIRLYSALRHGVPQDTDRFVYSLKIIFPLSLGMLFGYVAFSGSGTRSDSSDKRP